MQPGLDVAWKQSAKDAQQSADGADGATIAGDDIAGDASATTDLSEGAPAAPPATSHGDGGGGGGGDDDDDAPPEPGASW